MLQEVAEGGKKGFYEGRIAEAIVKVVRQHGGVMRSKDLADHMSTFVEPISTNYKGVRLWEIPANGQGIVALMTLNLLEKFDLNSMCIYTVQKCIYQSINRSINQSINQSIIVFLIHGISTKHTHAHIINN